MIGDEAVGAVALAGGPVACRQVGIGDGVAQPVVEAVIDRGQQTALRSEVVIEGAGTQSGATGQPTEFEGTVSVYELVAGRLGSC